MATSPSDLCRSSTGELGDLLLVRQVHFCLAELRGSLKWRLGSCCKWMLLLEPSPSIGSALQLSRFWECPCDMIFTPLHLSQGSPLCSQATCPFVHCAVRVAQGAAPKSEFAKKKAEQLVNCTVWPPVTSL